MLNKPLLVGQKSRDPATGYLVYSGVTAASGTEETPRKVLIVDDICDGGMTFTLCAEALRKSFPSTEEVDLYVTHGIFSKGRAIAGITNAYAYNIWSE